MISFAKFMSRNSYLNNDKIVLVSNVEHLRLHKNG